VIEADASRGHKVDGKRTTWPEEEKLTRPVMEYLAALDQAAAGETAGTKDADNLPPGNPPAVPKVTSLTDPTAAWTNKGQMKVGFAYGTNYLIDLQRSGDRLPIAGISPIRSSSPARVILLRAACSPSSAVSAAAAFSSRWPASLTAVAR